MQSEYTNSPFTLVSVQLHAESDAAERDVSLAPMAVQTWPNKTTAIARRRRPT